MRLLACVVLFLFYVKFCSSSNIVFILTDDQDLTLDGMMPMEKTKRLIGDQGITFVNAMVDTPLCCPSRSSILTGRYVHNHGCFNNSVSGGCNSRHWRHGPETLTYASFLQRANYTTFYAGKYLNQYGHKHAGGVSHVPAGWDWWYGLVGNSQYYNYSLSVNGTEEKHLLNPDKDYLTSVIQRRAVEFIKTRQKNQPFLMVLSTPAPHSPFTPLPKYEKHFSNLNAPRTSNFNIKVNKDKHWLLRQAPSPLTQKQVDRVDEIFRNRSRTLLSVDDLVCDVVITLQQKGLLDDTYIFYSSDHGYHLGQFSLPIDKRQPYEFDIRIPLLVRGPGLPKGVVSKSLVSSIDIAPTFLKLAGIKPPEYMDGRPLLPLNEWVERNYLLVTHAGEGKDNKTSWCPNHSGGGLHLCDTKFGCKCQDSRNNSYGCVRELSHNSSMLYCQFKDAENLVESYDLNWDRFQMQNIASILKPYVVNKYKFILDYLLKCFGYNCHVNDTNIAYN